MKDQENIFDLKRVIESKKALRRDLARLPVGEKLRMLDAMRACILSIKSATFHAEPSAVKETPAAYLAKDRKKKTKHKKS
jgi:hypothetical protein